MREEELIRAALQADLPDREEVYRRSVSAAEAATEAASRMRYRRLVAAACAAVVLVTAVVTAALWNRGDATPSLLQVDRKYEYYGSTTEHYDQLASILGPSADSSPEDNCYYPSTGQHKPDVALVRVRVLTDGTSLVMPETSKPGASYMTRLEKTLEVVQVCHAGEDISLKTGDRLTDTVLCRVSEKNEVVEPYNQQPPLVEGLEYYVYIYRNADGSYTFGNRYPLCTYEELASIIGHWFDENKIRTELIARYGG